MYQYDGWFMLALHSWVGLARYWTVVFRADMIESSVASIAGTLGVQKVMAMQFDLAGSAHRRFPSRWLRLKKG